MDKNIPNFGNKQLRSKLARGIIYGSYDPPWEPIPGFETSTNST